MCKGRVSPKKLIKCLIVGVLIESDKTTIAAGNLNDKANYENKFKRLKQQTRLVKIED